MFCEVYLHQPNNVSFDISELTTPISFTDNINVSGITTFSIIPNGVTPEVGNVVEIMCDDIYIRHYIFKANLNEDGAWKVTCYDQLRYLKANDTFVFKNNERADQIVRYICDTFSEKKMQLGILENTGYPLGKMTFDNKPMLDMIADAVTKILVDTKKLYFLKDNGGKIEFRNIQNCVSDLVIAPDSLLYGFNYERDIDSDTYNQIKLIRDNKETGQREVFMTKDSGNIAKWGTLQYYEKLDDNINEAQAKEKAESLLFLKNRVGQKLSVDVIGEKDIRAGNMIYLDLPDAGLNKFLLCTTAKHEFTNAAHTVKADFKVV